MSTTTEAKAATLSVQPATPGSPLSVVVDLVDPATVDIVGVSYRQQAPAGVAGVDHLCDPADVGRGFYQLGFDLVGTWSDTFRIVALVSDASGISEAPFALYTPTSANDWPSADDVRKMLRAEGISADDEDVLAWSLDAAIAWIRGRVKPAAIADASGATLIVPDVWQATVLEACRLYRRRDSLDGTLGWGDAGLVRVGIYDPDVEHLLGHWLAIPL